MCRCADRRYLTGSGIEPIDPDIVDERLALVTDHTRSVVDACRYHLSPIDPAERLKDRLDQKMYLSRYGRINPFEWADRDVNELTEHYLAMSTIIGEENALSRISEDK